MEPKMEQCTKRKAIKAIQTANEYLVITQEGKHTKIAYEGGRGLLGAVATALDSNSQVRTLFNTAALLVVMKR